MFGISLIFDTILPQCHTKQKQQTLMLMLKWTGFLFLAFLNVFEKNHLPKTLFQTLKVDALYQISICSPWTGGGDKGQK